MKFLKPNLFLLYIIPVLCLVFPSAPFSEILKKELKKGNTESMVIKSNTLEIDNKQKIVTFTGNVYAQRDSFTVNCKKMLLYYHDQNPGKKPGKENMKIKKIVATGKVRIIRQDGGVAMAERAVYFQEDEKVVLTGHPVIKQGNDFVEGSKITLFLKEKRSIVEGSARKKVRAVLSPRSKKGSPLGR